MEIKGGKGLTITELKTGAPQAFRNRQQAAGHRASLHIFTNRGLVGLPFARNVLLGERVDDWGRERGLVSTLTYPAMRLDWHLH